MNAADGVGGESRIDRRFTALFTSYIQRMARRDFHRVRLARGSVDVCRAAAMYSGPVIIVMNHASWWDPLIGLLFGRTMLAGRIGIAPMDADQLRRFSFMKRLGLFGIDPDSPDALGTFQSIVSAYFARHGASGRPTLMITPQGEFADVRTLIRLRPGAAAVAARTDGAKVFSLAVEYAFWQSRKPEVFLRLVEIVPDDEHLLLQAGPAQRPTIATWHRALTRAMQANAEALGALVIARDESKFQDMLESTGTSINPLFDLWLRATGRGGEISARRQERSTHADATSVQQPLIASSKPDEVVEGRQPRGSAWATEARP